MKWTGFKLNGESGGAAGLGIVGRLTYTASRSLLGVAFVVGLFLTTPTHAAEPPDLLRLRDVLCAKESRTAPTPTSVVNLNRETGQWDIGICQISMARLIDMGFLSTLRKPSTRNPKWIVDNDGQRSITLEIVTMDYLGIERRGQHPTAPCLIVKFHWGKNARCTKARLAHPYTQDVLAMMQATAAK